MSAKHPHFHAVELNVLDLQMAKRIIRFLWNVDTPTPTATADLTLFSRIEPEAIRFLAQYPYGFVNLKISTITGDLAAELGRWDGVTFFTFFNLTRIEPDAAKALCRKDHSLSFVGLDGLPAEAAKELARCRGQLFLDLKRSISPDAAKELAEHCGTLIIWQYAEPSPDSGAWLAKHKGGDLQFSLRKKPSQDFLSMLHSNSNKSVRCTRIPGRIAETWDIEISDKGEEALTVRLHRNQP